MASQPDRSANQRILHRPRLDSLIGEGLKHPLLVMLAAPGYGKTQAMADYAASSDAVVLWLHLNATDNLPGRFWERLVRVLTGRYPELEARLSDLEFPENIHTFAAFAQIIEENICQNGQVILVFDDYGSIENRQVKDFILLLVDAGLEGLHLVLLSNALDSMESVAFMTTRRALLLANELRFTKSEIRELFRMYGVKLSAGELDAIERFTEGWPLPLCLLASQYEDREAFSHSGERLTPRVISHLFEERFFLGYSRAQQKLLVKLSMPDSFTKPFAFGLYKGPAAELEPIVNHAFLINEPNTDRFYLHHLYRTFLQEKAYLLSDDEKNELWQSAAEYHLSSGNMPEAVTCYRKSGDRIKMLNTIVYAASSEFGTTEQTAAFLLEHLDLLTPEELEQNPAADGIRALLYIVTYQLDKAQPIVLTLEQRLLKNGTPEALALLGEVYLIHGLLQMMRGKEDFGVFFEKSAGYLPNGSISAKRGAMKVHNNHSFFMQDSSYGARQRIERAVHSGIPWMTKVMKGAMSGMPELFSAESAYLSFDFEGAKQHAYRSIFEAEAESQHDLVMNAYCMLTRIGFMQGDFQEVNRHIKIITEYADKYEISVLKEIRDTALGWYYVKMRDFKRVPKSIISTDYVNKLFSSFARPMTVYTNYLLGMGEFAQAIGWLDHIMSMRTAKAVDQDIIFMYVMHAIGHSCLGNDELAMQSLWKAYKMCYSNGLITIFIEADKYMTSLIETARRQKKYSFAPEWLDLIGREAAEFTARADAVRAAYRRQNPAKLAKNNPLSGRELAVLQSVARGLTREEIALEQYISMNTVKSTIASIFNKLGASNKADAVSIAITKGYIEGYSPEF